MIIIESMLRIATGSGTIAALVGALLFGFLGYAGASLTHAVTDGGVAWATIKGAVFGSWLLFTPFAIWSLLWMLAGK